MACCWRDVPAQQACSVDNISSFMALHDSGEALAWRQPCCQAWRPACAALQTQGCVLWKCVSAGHQPGNVDTVIFISQAFHLLAPDPICPSRGCQARSNLATTCQQTLRRQPNPLQYSSLPSPQPVLGRNAPNCFAQITAAAMASPNSQPELALGLSDLPLAWLHRLSVTLTAASAARLRTTCAALREVRAAAVGARVLDRS